MREQPDKPLKMMQNVIVFERNGGYWNISSGSTNLMGGYFLDGEIVTEYSDANRETMDALLVLLRANQKEISANSITLFPAKWIETN